MTFPTSFATNWRRVLRVPASRWQEYLRMMLVEQTMQPTVDDVIARARARVAATGSLVSADAILGARDAERR